MAMYPRSRKWPIGARHRHPGREPPRSEGAFRHRQARCRRLAEASSNISGQYRLMTARSGCGCVAFQGRVNAELGENLSSREVDALC